MGCIRPFQKRLLILSLILILLAGFVPRISRIDGEYTALRCSEDAYNSGTEEFSTVTLRLHGFYLSTPVGNDRYYGTLHILDYPREGKNSGGRFDPMELGQLFETASTQWGGLFYYSEKRNRYESLGTITCDLLDEKIFITHEDDIIAYPAQSVADAQALWAQLTAH